MNGLGFILFNPANQFGMKRRAQRRFGKALRGSRMQLAKLRHLLPIAKTEAGLAAVIGHEVAHVREASVRETERTVAMTGPFEGFQVRVSATETSPVAFAHRLVVIEVAFISLLALVMLGATFVGVRYIMRQIDLVNAKSSFVSNVTHELKTPVAVIKAYGEVLGAGTGK